MTVCCWLLAAAAYTGFMLFLFRMMSYKWHPDGGGEQSETRHNDGS